MTTGQLIEKLKQFDSGSDICIKLDLNTIENIHIGNIHSHEMDTDLYPIMNISSISDEIDGEELMVYLTL